MTLIIIGVTLFLILLLFLFWELEKKILYSPTHHDERSIFEKSPDSYVLEHLKVSKNIYVEGIIYEPKDECSQSVLYFGGKMQDSVSLVSKLSLSYPETRIIAFNYRAYGTSHGKPSQKNIFNDALYIYDTMSERYLSLHVMGYSLGSSVASFVASKRNPKNLILISAFDSILAFAKKQYPYLPKILFKNPFRSDLYVQEVNAPTYLYVTVDDDVVDIDNARILHKNIKNLVDYVEFSGYDHSSLLFSDEVIERVKKIVS